MEMAEESHARRLRHLLMAPVLRVALSLTLPLLFLGLLIYVLCSRLPAQPHLLQPSEVNRE